MAYTEHLPIYKKAYDLAVYFEKLFPALPKKYKHSLGQDIRGGIFKVVSTIVKINSLPIPERLRLFQELEHYLSDAELYIKISSDVGGFLKQSEKERLIFGLNDLRRQMYGWRKTKAETRSF